MSRYVVYESHQFEDDKCEMPDMDDFESLSEKIIAIKKLCSTAVTKKAFETRIAEAERNIADAKQQTEDMLKAFSAAMTNGEWREGFKRDIGQALEQLERRYAAINDELNKKIEELSKVSELEAVLSQRIIEFQENIRNVIEGRQVVPPPVPRKAKWYSRLIQWVSKMIPQKLRGLFSRD